MSILTKFRGKRADNGEWVYGDLLRVGGGSIIFFGSQTETQTPDIPNSSPVAVELFNDEIAVVIPATVGQYTGVDDVNGNPIFEGDIVETFSIHLAYQQVGNYPPPNIEVEEWEVNQSVNEVEFSYGSFNINGYPIMFEDMVYGDDKDDKSEDRQIFESLWVDNCYDLQDEYPYLTWEYFCKPHIIGNIHDNPELINQKTEI